MTFCQSCTSNPVARARSNTELPGIGSQVPVTILVADGTEAWSPCSRTRGLVGTSPTMTRGRIAMAAISPLASWSDHGIPARAAILLGQARIRHTAEIHVSGRTPGRDDHRLPRADRQPGAVVFHRIPSTRPASWRCNATIWCRVRICTPASRAAASNGRINPLPEGLRRLHGGIGRFAGLHHRPVHDRGMHLPRHRVSHRVAARGVRCLVHEDHPVRHKPLKSRRYCRRRRE